MEKELLPNEVMLGEVARLLEEGREVVMKPKGFSMLPFIRGDIDSVALHKPEQLKVGDIALARFNGKYILHRVIALEGDKVTLMGDGNLSGTEKGSRSEVFGIVTEIISPEGRHHKPGKGRWWRRLLPVRRYLLKAYRKWNKLVGKPY